MSKSKFLPAHAVFCQSATGLRIQTFQDLGAAEMLAKQAAVTFVPPGARAKVLEAVGIIKQRVQSASRLRRASRDAVTELLDEATTAIKEQPDKLATDQNGTDTATTEQTLAAAEVDKAVGVDKVVGTS